MQSTEKYIGPLITPRGTQFSVWAPAHDALTLIIEGGDSLDLARSGDGWFSALVPDVGHGTRYQLGTADGMLMPDPASRFQPEGPHGPSMVIDPARFTWTDHGWQGPPGGRQIIYEMHVGTFTPEGTWRAAADQLEYLAELGITIIELMPVAEFPGRFNWGYDGVALFAPTHNYGVPDDMRAFVDRAHARGIAVILDVVYNHLGPDGNYLGLLAPQYFSSRYTTDWGDALNFDDAGSEHVREFFLANAEYWIRDFHLDGLRFDATQNIYDAGPQHILTDIDERIRVAATARRLWTVAENEPQNIRMVMPTGAGGHGMDAMWNDDFHHTARVALTGVSEAYYSDYGGTPQELISCARHGFLYQGQHYAWQKQRRGTSTALIEGAPFVNFLQNHDQIANSDSGRRIHELTAPALLRAMTAFMLLIPGHVMLFQGQEFASTSRFLFFADHAPELAERVRRGRREFLAQFRSTALPRVQQRIPDPADHATFALCVLDHRERGANRHIVSLHRDLIRIARHDPVISSCARGAVDGTVIAEDALALRYTTTDGERLLVLNLGADAELPRAPYPQLAPPSGRRWRALLTTEDPRYGGRGGPEPEHEDGRWMLVAQSAALLEPHWREKTT